MSGIIEVTDLRKEFSIKSGVEVAVDDISFTISEGEFITIVGPSGCGKTTTLRCIAGLETPTSGTINFNGYDVTDVPPNKRNLSMMFQDIALYPHMTTRENIAYPLKVDRVDEETRKQEAEEAAKIMKIEDMLEKYPGELSGGQQQRVALARTIVQEPLAFLMDEPLSDLDANLQVEIRKEIQRVHKRLGKPTIYVTHNQEEAMTMSDQIIVMNDGDIEQMGPGKELYRYPTNTFIAQFIGNPNINLIDGALDVGDDGRATVTIGEHSAEFTVDTEFADTAPSGEVIVGIRPRDLSIDGEGVSNLTLPGKLTLLEPLDENALATLSTDRGEFRAIVPTDTPVDEGEAIDIGIRTDNLYFFDPKTSELVLKSAKETKRSVNTATQT